MRPGGFAWPTSNKPGFAVFAAENMEDRSALLV
jgi:hypothetical protein